MRHRLAAPLVLVLVALALGAIGCRPSPANITTVVGDSLTMTALLEGGFPPDWDIHSMLGWQAEDAQPGVTARVNDPALSPARAAIALGQNDAAKHTGGPGDGLTAVDVEQLRTLRTTFDPATVVLWVLPDYEGTDPAYRAGIEQYRAWAASYAATLGDCIIDWRAHAEPGDIDPADGVHLTHEGRLAYADTIEQGIAACV